MDGTQRYYMKLPFQKSIQAKLSLAFAVVSILTSAITAAVSFVDTYKETHVLQDDMLEQIAAYLSNHEKPHNLPDSDNEARIFVQHALYPNQNDLPIPQKLGSGLHDYQYDGDNYRIFIKDTPEGRIVVTQENEYRKLLATRSAWSSAIPLLIMIPLTTLLTLLLMGHALRPMRKLSKDLEQREATDLAALPMNNVPQEIIGFVAAINRLLGKTATTMEQQQRFIADAAHELRSPMTALSIQAERLSKQNLPDAAKQSMDDLSQSIYRSRHLLEQLLSLARAQARDSHNRESYVAIQAIFSRVIVDLLPIAEQKEQDLGVVSNHSVQLLANELEIYTLVKTLTDNAIRYTDIGGQIDLSVAEDNKWVMITVEDNGRGIPEAERERVLDPFYRVLGHEQSGTGLGLPIAKTIAEHYQGYVSLQDSVTFEQGLQVVVYLKKNK